MTLFHKTRKVYQIFWSCEKNFMLHSPLVMNAFLHWKLFRPDNGLRFFFLIFFVGRGCHYVICENASKNRNWICGKTSPPLQTLLCSKTHGYEDLTILRFTILSLPKNRKLILNKMLRPEGQYSQRILYTLIDSST